MRAPACPAAATTQPARAADGAPVHALLTACGSTPETRDLDGFGKLMSGRSEDQLIRRDGKWLFARREGKRITDTPQACRQEQI